MDYKRLNDLLLTYWVELIDDNNVINMLLQYPFDLSEDDLLELGFDIQQINNAIS